MFVDASAIVAILTSEEGADALADRLDSAAACITSPIAVFESTVAICRKRLTSVAEANGAVREFLDLARINVVAVAPADGNAALEAFTRYGKGRSHPAQLNMADCFAYAMTRRHGMPLLFKGDDFAKTDLAEGEP
jgi:ribonuclease VapC